MALIYNSSVSASASTSAINPIPYTTFTQSNKKCEDSKYCLKANCIYWHEGEQCIYGEQCYYNKKCLCPYVHPQHPPYQNDNADMLAHESDKLIAELKATIKKQANTISNAKNTISRLEAHDLILKKQLIDCTTECSNMKYFIQENGLYENYCSFIFYS